MALLLLCTEDLGNPTTLDSPSTLLLQVLIMHGADAMPELLVSSAACLSQPVPIAACPHVPLRTGLSADVECKCSDESSHVLNCDGNEDAT